MRSCGSKCAEVQVLNRVQNMQTHQRSDARARRTEDGKHVLRMRFVPCFPEPRLLTMDLSGSEIS